MPSAHALRPIRTRINEALAKMNEKLSEMYEADIQGGRPSITPESLMRAILLRVVYSVRSERQFVEQYSQHLLLRWLVGLAFEAAVCKHLVFSTKTQRIQDDAVTEVFNATSETARREGLLSGEHFSADGTLIQACASYKSMRRAVGSDDGTPPEDWRCQKRINHMHESKTDPQSRLYRKRNAALALPSCVAQGLTGNLHGLAANVRVRQSNRFADREVPTAMLAYVA